MHPDYISNCTIGGIANVPSWLCGPDPSSYMYPLVPSSNDTTDIPYSMYDASNLSSPALSWDNGTSPAPTPESPYSQLLDSSRFWIQRVLVPIITIIGVVGNTVTIVIMTRRRMRSSTNSYLAALAICDMLYLLCVFALSLKHYQFIQEQGLYIYYNCFPLIVMLADACSNTSVWLTATFTMERYIAVCHPIRGKVLCTESRARKAIFIVFAFCFSFTLPTLFEYSVTEKHDPVTNTTRTHLDASELGKNELYKKIYYWLTVVLFTVIPFLLLAIFNAFLVRSVHLSRKQRSRMTQRTDSSRDNQENKITVMLIAVVILFFVCQLPTAVTLLYTSIRSPEPDTDGEKLIFILGNIFNFLMTINAAGNFILYCLLSQKYRRTFLQIFCPCTTSRFARLQSVYHYSGAPATMNSVQDDNSPAGNRRFSSTRSVKSTRSNSASVVVDNQKVPASQGSFLKVPGQQEKEVNSNDAHSDRTSGTSEKNSVSCGVTCSLWRKLKLARKAASGVGANHTADHVIPLQGAKDCVVVIRGDGAPTNKCIHTSV
ncbi:FMRFamide receptor-like isoform X1 [Ornithodoros turicata]|uniref:FMRFamide receptor-like isoform X1 n=1 Tax=Ornithodoros turicata TaxID=34597 RepID=UPI003139F8A1